MVAPPHERKDIEACKARTAAPVSFNRFSGQALSWFRYYPLAIFPTTSCFLSELLIIAAKAVAILVSPRLPN
jgi:hypothetical protein